MWSGFVASYAIRCDLVLWVYGTTYFTTSFASHYTFRCLFTYRLHDFDSFYMVPIMKFSFLLTVLETMTKHNQAGIEAVKALCTESPERSQLSGVMDVILVVL